MKRMIWSLATLVLLASCEPPVPAATGGKVSIPPAGRDPEIIRVTVLPEDRKSTRLNSSH